MRRPLLNEGIDAVARDARKSEVSRAFSAAICAIFVGANTSLITGLFWFLGAFSALVVCRMACMPSGDNAPLTDRQRLLVVAAMLFETSMWAGSAAIYWMTGQPALQIVAVAVVCGQLIHAQSYTYRALLPLIINGGPPALLLLVLPLMTGNFKGLQLLSIEAGVCVLIYYAIRSALTNQANMVALGEQQSFATGVIDAIDARIGVVDAHGRVINANRAWRERLGALDILSGEPVGTHFQDHCDHLPGRQGNALSRGLKRVLNGEVERFSMAFRSDLTPQSEWHKLIASPLSGAGEAKLVVVQHRITELKRTEDKLRRTNVILSRAREEAEAANRAKSSFLATMSHEIRTPLNGVVAIADVLSRAELGESERDMVDTIRASADSLSRLLADMLDLARIESGRVALESKPFHLGDAVRAVISLNNLAASEKGVQLWSEIDQRAEAWVMGDVTRVKQILTNLVSNAVKFTSEGEVLVHVTARRGNGFEIRVADTGVGFDSADKARLFGRFEQADSSITRRFGGSGLGLAIIKELAEFMGGELDCESRPGEGSTFTVRLKLNRTAAPPVSVDSVAPEHLSDTELSILVVDDHPTNRKVTDLILRGTGARLTMAENGLEAVEAFKAARFDVILMDMQMPVMDGVAATRKIRSLEVAGDLPRTPIIMFSANALAEHLTESMAAGADMHLAKPVSAVGLLNAIVAMVDHGADDGPAALTA